MLVNRLLRSGAKKAGKRIASAAERDAQDIRNEIAKERAARYGPGKDFVSEHDHDLHDLITTDKGVSASWIRELIDNSKTPEQLSKVMQYLKDDARAYNLTSSMRKGLRASTTEKIQAIKDQELIHKFATFLREHGDDLF